MSAELGLVPAAYSCKLDKPSPSGSALESAAELGFNPYACSQPSGKPSLSVSGLVGSVPAEVSCALVKPSLSQSAPPSLGSSGSEPSAITTPALEASIIAVKTARSPCRIFVEIFSILIILLGVHREPAVPSTQL